MSPLLKPAGAVSVVISKSPGLSTYNVANNRRSSKASKKCRLANGRLLGRLMDCFRREEKNSCFMVRSARLRLIVMGIASLSPNGWLKHVGGRVTQYLQTGAVAQDVQNSPRLAT